MSNIQKFSVNHYPINSVLTWIRDGEIAIPEIQRPFVWDTTKVRDLIDSLYRGYPIGYLIAWTNPNVRLKDGTISKGKKILIDGQQRVTALMAAILGKEIVTKEYSKKRITISFNPIDRTFEVFNTAIAKDKRWVPDISEIFRPGFKILDKLDEFMQNNPNVDRNSIYDALDSLSKIQNILIGLIELNSELDIEEVTEIFIRINSSGVILNQADFAMSKIAVDDKFGGNILRKAIDYFCHLAVKPDFYYQIVENDKAFANTPFFQKMSWLKDDNETLYDPTYTDLLRVAFTYKFKRGKLQDLVALLSGRDFETREFKEEIAENSFKTLSLGIQDFINENNFKQLMLIIKSAGFIDSSMILSQNAIDFSYIIYLYLKEKGFPKHKIEKLVRKWFVYATLKSLYSGSPESQFDKDIRKIETSDPEEYIENVINSELSDNYWLVSLPQQLETSATRNPAFKTFLAAQVKMNDKGFLSKDITVSDLISIKGDVHHIFPKDYLKKLGYDKSMYNQVANYVMAQSEINVSIGNKPPLSYFKEIFNQCRTKVPKYGAIIDEKVLIENLESHCIPYYLFNGNNEPDYQLFLQERRKLMALKIKKYFDML
ncbi:MAG: DUF262 domain-containing protein [Ignavibacteria bacterium]|nr:DUF262 domain-containing protein [Ignavibacteria bacterium]